MLCVYALVSKLHFLTLNRVCVICSIDFVISSYRHYHMELHMETAIRRSLLCFPCSILRTKADFGASLSFAAVCSVCRHPLLFWISYAFLSITVFLAVIRF